MTQFQKRALLITLGVVLLASLVSVVMLLGPDPGRSARMRYLQPQEDIRDPTTPTDIASPTPSERVTVLPAEAPAMVDLTTSVPPEMPGVRMEPEVEFQDDPITQSAIVIPTPPPVPQSILTGTRSDFDGINERSPPPITRIETANRRYRFNNRAVDAAEAVMVRASAEQMGISPTHFAPMGEIIQVVLLENVISTDVEIPVSAGVWNPMYFQGRKLLDIGDKLVGVAQPGKKRDRLSVKFDRVIFRDGRSTAIAGIARNTDGSAGIPGKVVGNLLLQSIAPILLESAAAFMSTFQERVLVGVGPTQEGFENASGGVQVLPTASNAGIQAGQGAVDTVSRLLAQDMEENRPYLVIPAGVRFEAYLTRYLDTSNPEYGQ